MLTDIFASSHTLYIIGFILVILYLSMGLDDFIWDMLTMTQKKKYESLKVDMTVLNAAPPRLLAVMIAAWHESAVLGDVVDNMILSTQYPRSMFHIFLGIYPNDPDTLKVAQALAQRHPNVKVIVNCKAGPTSKAQNLNYVISEILRLEQEGNCKYAGITVHDSEDIMHPYELKLTNYLLAQHDALQFPVFPLQEMPKHSNFFRNLTSGTYADEFAENHYTTMVNRCSVDSFVPSAGTGFALSHRVLDVFQGEDIFPSDSLTEDYRLSLTLRQRGIKLYYALEKVLRLNGRGKLVWEFVATRSRFPTTFQAAVRQKTRWILGITMQSFRFRDIFKGENLTLLTRYTMYKDLKAKIGNLLVVLGYPILLYFFASLFLTLPPIYPQGSPSWWLCVAVTIMMLERQVFRAVAISKVYGWRSTFISCFLPPILPIRLVWGNIINLTATLKAWKQHTTGARKAKKQKTKKVHAWSKTDHEFLEPHILKRFHRNLGDVLLEQNLVTYETLRDALDAAGRLNKPLGQVLLEGGTLKESQLLGALALIKHIQYIDPQLLPDLQLTGLCHLIPRKTLESLSTVPLLKAPTGYVFAFCDKSPTDAQTQLRQGYHIDIHAVFAESETVTQALNMMFSGEVSSPPTYILQQVEAGQLSYEQALIALQQARSLGLSQEETVSLLGVDLARPTPVHHAERQNDPSHAIQETVSQAAVP